MKGHNKSYTVIDKTHEEPLEDVDGSITCFECGKELSLSNHYVYDGLFYCEEHCPNLDIATEVK